MRVILLGAPGSGKGTVGDLVTSAYGLPRVSTGDLLRAAVQKETPLGLKAREQMGRGGLVDDALVLELLRDRLAAPDAGSGYLLDGYPRNLDQARSLEALDGRRPETVFEIRTDEDVVVARLSNRRICPVCGAVYNLMTKKPASPGVCDVEGARLVQRDDDKPAIIRERMRTYETKTAPLVAHYRAKGNFHSVDGNGTVQQTFEPIRDVLDQRLPRAAKERVR